MAYDPNNPSSDYVYKPTTDAGKKQAEASGYSSKTGKKKITAKDVVNKIGDAAKNSPYYKAGKWLKDNSGGANPDTAKSNAAAAATKAYSAANSSTGGVGSAAGKTAETKELISKGMSPEQAEKAYTEKHGGTGGSSGQTGPSVAPPAAPAAPVAPVDPSDGTSYQGASDQMQAYDQYAQQALGKSPAEAMQMAQAASAQQAQSVSDQAVQQAAKGARTSGAMGGQAALAATGQAANAYGQAQQAGQQQYFNTAQLGAQLGSEMSGRLQTKEGDATQRYGIEKNAQAAAAANKTAQRGQNIGLLGQGIGVIGGLAGLFSDKNLKTDIAPDKMTEGLAKIKSYSYKYKGGTKPEAGVMAQDLEKTAMAPAVEDTPIGKKIDTNRLTTMNTGALSEHEKRLQNIEKMVGNLKSYKKPGAK